MSNSTKWLRSLVWALALVAVNVFPSGDDKNKDKDKDKPKDKKVTLCHKGQTLELPEAAVQAHLNHGDTLGPCEVTPSQNR